MSANRKIGKITFWITIVSLLVIVLQKIDNQSIYYDIILAIFGSSALSCLTACISYNSDIRKIKRTVITNVIQIQTKVKSILSEYSKVLDDWDENDFFKINTELFGLFDEFFSYSTTIRFETGKELAELFKFENITELYKLYADLDNGLCDIGIFLKHKKEEEAYKKYKECYEFNKEIIKKLEVLLKKEYGKHFAALNSIGLL